jgi:anaerobic sulfite reductase subunit B
MYKFVVLELLSRGFLEGRIYMSFERRMCCGMGKCGQCQINGVYVCKNGPVFRYLDAKRLPEAL